jgi:tetratricopeptide (TPR) repeat protein
MSLIHEALKKAEREQSIPPSLASPRFNVARSRPTRPIGALLLLSVLAVGAVVFVVTRSDPRDVAAPPVAPTAGRPPAQAPALAATEANELIASAATAHGKGDYPAAEALLTRALGFAPESPLAHNNLGLAIKAQGRADEAEKHYLAALQHEPQYVRAVNNLAVLYDQQNRIDEAFRLYASAVRIDPDYPDARLNYAVALERSGFLADARKQYEAFLANAAGDQSRATELVRRRLAALP